MVRTLNTAWSASTSATAARRGAAARPGSATVLDEELKHDLPPPGAERDSKPRLALARHGPREEQMRHVDAGNQQKNETAASNSSIAGLTCASTKSPSGTTAKPRPRFARGNCSSSRAANRGHLGVGLSSPHAGLQPPEHPPVGIAARLADRRRRRRNPELHLRVGQHRRAGSAHREVEAGRHHPHNRPRCVVDRDGPPHHGGVARETARPEVVADDSHRFVRGPDVAPEHAADGRRHAEGLEVSR